MIHEQIEGLLEARPFRPFEMLLSDQRKVTVANLGFVSLLGDRRSVAVYELPDEADNRDQLFGVNKLTGWYLSSGFGGHGSKHFL